MKKEQIEMYKNKKVKIFLKSSRTYTGTITEIDNDSISMIDKFNNPVTLSLDTLSEIILVGDF